jgi:hypothetical protein
LTDEEGEIKDLVSGAFIQLEKGERHRLIGLDSWGIVAEIWQHTDLISHQTKRILYVFKMILEIIHYFNTMNAFLPAMKSS